MKSNFSIQLFPRLLGVLFILVLLMTGLASAGQKNKKPLPPPAPPPTPTTGSLFTDQGRLVNVYSEFRAQQIGDIVFVDIVETSAASVSSNAKNAREGSNLGAAVIAAAPIPGQIAGAAAGVAGA
ncbi:MAG TPA: flagellar basal body L-ring protein FlgH, partial [Acidobacteriota bacterium]|nr:flagellar basal body L-ring protein FlgH [Acidobacteriota bacterium]